MSRADGLERRQRARIAVGVPAAGPHGERVTATLALLPDQPGNPPDRRVEKEKRFDDVLNQICEVIEAPQVRQFVGEQHLELRQAQTADGARWHQDEGSQITDDQRHVDDFGDAHGDGWAHPQSLGEVANGSFDVGRDRRDRHRAKPVRGSKSQDEPHRVDQHAEKPEGDHPRQCGGYALLQHQGLCASLRPSVWTTIARGNAIFHWRHPNWRRSRDGIRRACQGLTR